MLTDSLCDIVRRGKFFEKRYVNSSVASTPMAGTSPLLLWLVRLKCVNRPMKKFLRRKNADVMLGS